jgi:hypothetical protein
MELIPDIRTTLQKTYITYGPTQDTLEILREKKVVNTQAH